jgi:membrane protein
MAHRDATEPQTEATLPGTEPPRPQPELHEPPLDDPGLTDLSRQDYVAIAKRSFREAMDDGITDLAAALAYYTFLALPSVLLLSLGLFTLVAGEDALDTVLDKIGTVAPQETVDLLRDSLTRAMDNQSGSIAMIAVGGVIALWAVTGAMTAFMRATNQAYERKETRGFVRQRLVALLMFVLIFLAFALCFGLLILGPHLSGWIGDVTGLETLVSWVWWVAQWPILILSLLVVFATLLYLAPNVEHPRWQLITPGALVAAVVWLVASGLFAVYVSMFGSYNKAWGSLATVVVMLTWLWLSALALLLGAEINAETQRSRELRQRKPAERYLQVPAKA